MCIITAGNIDDHMCLSKTRDRNYDPVLSVWHGRLQGVEVFALIDVLTGWAEGINEYGIGVVNSALMVARDEAEKERAKGKGHKKSKDGRRILEALSKTTLAEATNTLLSWEGGIKGHTYVGDGQHLNSLEATSKHRPFSQGVDPNALHVRTNHGVHHQDAGYGEGDNLNSSLVRKELAYEALRNVSVVEDFLPALHTNVFEPGSLFACIRNIEDGMRTSSQLLLDLTDKRALVYINPACCTLKEPIVKVENPKIRWEVRDWPASTPKQV